MVIIGFLGWLSFALAFIAILPFIGAHYNFPSQSMAPTIYSGEHIYVLNFGYGFLGYKSPTRGNVYTFKAGKNGRIYINRLIGYLVTKSKCGEDVYI